MKTGPNTANVQGQRRRAAAPIGGRPKSLRPYPFLDQSPAIPCALSKLRGFRCFLFALCARTHDHQPPYIVGKFHVFTAKTAQIPTITNKTGIIYPHGITAKYGPFLWVPCSCSVEVLRGAGFLFLFYQLKPYGNYGDQYAPKQIDEKNLAPVVDF